MSLFSFFKKSKAEKSVDNRSGLSQSNVVSHEDEDEITAVISAVLASMEDEETETVAAITAAIACILGKSTSEFIVRNIKRSHELDSVWAQAGRMKLMR